MDPDFAKGSSQEYTLDCEPSLGHHLAGGCKRPSTYTVSHRVQFGDLGYNVKSFLPLRAAQLFLPDGGASIEAKPGETQSTRKISIPRLDTAEFALCLLLRAVGIQKDLRQRAWGVRRKLA